MVIVAMKVDLKRELDNKALKIVLTYPFYNEETFLNRVRELLNLGVRWIEFCGNVMIGNIRVIGKGTVGIVVIGYLETTRERVAIKIRRVDASRNSLLHEAEYLRLANKVGVGPILHKATDNFIIREYVEGELFQDWYPNRSPTEIIKVMFYLLEQAYKLDMIGLTHKQLSRIDKHVIVKKNYEPVIIDFETASLGSTKRNLTQVIQYFLLRNKYLSNIVRTYLSLTEKDLKELFITLRAYKRNPQAYYNIILNSLKKRIT